MVHLVVGVSSDTFTDGQFTERTDDGQNPCPDQLIISELLMRGERINLVNLRRSFKVH